MIRRDYACVMQWFRVGTTKNGTGSNANCCQKQSVGAVERYEVSKKHRYKALLQALMSDPAMGEAAAAPESWSCQSCSPRRNSLGAWA